MSGAPVSPEPTVVVAPTLTTEEVIADTLTDDLMSAFAATQGSTSAFTRTNTMVGFSLEDLFGKGGCSALLHKDDTSVVVNDPALFDTETMLRDVFGGDISFVHDAFTVADANNYQRLQRAVQDALLADHMSELDECFGPNAEYVKEESGVSLRPNVIMSAAYPVKANVNDLETSEGKAAALIDSTLLLTMPTVYPNRQILHFDTAPYNPMTSRPKESTDRKSFTAQNIMMWTYDVKKKQYLSNTRVVQWSDGTTTLHVGAQTYDIETFTDGALSFLGERRHMYRSDKAYSALVETVPVDNHVTVRPRSDKQNPDLLTASSTAKTVSENAALTIGLPISGLPAFVGDAGGRKSVEEEYVDAERNALKKLIAQMERNGTPMSTAEQMRRDAQILTDVINIGKGIDSLVAQQHERKRVEAAEKEAAKAERDAANAGKLGSKRVRIPGGLEGGEKRSRTERNTDREPTAYDNGMTAEEETEAMVASAEEVDLSGDLWRDVVYSRLDAIRNDAFDDSLKEAVDNVKLAIATLSRGGAAGEIRQFIEEATEVSVADQVEALDAIATRLEQE